MCKRLERKDRDQRDQKSNHPHKAAKPKQASRPEYASLYLGRMAFDGAHQSIPPGRVERPEFLVGQPDAVAGIDNCRLHGTLLRDCASASKGGSLVIGSAAILVRTAGPSYSARVCSGHALAGGARYERMKCPYQLPEHPTLAAKRDR
jgi:hypothetical protein